MKSDTKKCAEIPASNIFSSKALLLVLISIELFVPLVKSQTGHVPREALEVSAGINDFTLELLRQEELKKNKPNIAVSAYSIWNVLSMVALGALGDTAREFRKVLNVNNFHDKNSFEKGYQFTERSIKHNTNGANVDISNVLFIDRSLPLSSSYAEKVTNVFNVTLRPVDFNNIPTTLREINNLIEQETKSRVKNFAKADELLNAKLLITSILYFKGLWKLPFNTTATLQQPFTDEFGNRRGTVKLMYQIGPYPFTRLPALNSHAVELPYGSRNKMSMIIILPKLGASLSEMLTNLTSFRMERVLDALQLAEQNYADEDIHVYIPKFSINSDYTLDSILFDMGLTLVFDDTADLKGITQDDLKLSHVIHRANIDVNEEGTVASAATGGSFQYKSPPAKFQADRPFAYFIVDKLTKLVVFCGQFTDPNAS